MNWTIAKHRRRELWLQDPDGYLLVLNEEKIEIEKPIANMILIFSPTFFLTLPR